MQAKFAQAIAANVYRSRSRKEEEERGQWQRQWHKWKTWQNCMPWLAAKSGRAAIFGLLSESNEAQNCRANCAQLCRMLIALGEFCMQGREWWQGREWCTGEGREWLQVGSVGSFDMLFFLQVTARLRTCIKVYVWVCVCEGVVWWQWEQSVRVRVSGYITKSNQSNMKYWQPQ